MPPSPCPLWREKSRRGWLLAGGPLPFGGGRGAKKRSLGLR